MFRSGSSKLRRRRKIIAFAHFKDNKMAFMLLLNYSLFKKCCSLRSKTLHLNYKTVVPIVALHVGSSIITKTIYSFLNIATLFQSLYNGIFVAARIYFETA